MEKKDLIEIFDLALKSHRFVRKAKAWYKRSAGTSFVVDLQKSNYGEQYYANLALIPGGVSVAGDPFPKEHHCPIRSRLSAVADEGQSKRLLDLENDVDDAWRKSELEETLSGVLLPFFEGVSAPKALCAAYAEGRLDNWSVRPEVRGLLNPAEAPS